MKPDPEALLAIAIHRWSGNDQKNHNVIYNCLAKILALNERVQVVIAPLQLKLTSSDQLARQFQQIAKRFRSRCYFDAENPAGWDGILRGADVQLMPSRWEPCGLNHAQGMAYGVVPICTRVGCMGEYPMDDCPPGGSGGNAYLFNWNESATPQQNGSVFLKAVKRATADFFKEPAKWSTIRANAMLASREYTWDSLVDKYARDLFPRIP